MIAFKNLNHLGKIDYSVNDHIVTGYLFGKYKYQTHTHIQHKQKCISDK